MYTIPGGESKTAIGIYFFEDRIDTVKLRWNNGDIYLLQADSEFYSEVNHSMKSSWRSDYLNRLVDANLGADDILRFCIPQQLTSLRKFRIDPSLLKDFPDWIEWMAKQHLPSSPEIYYFRYYPVYCAAPDFKNYLVISYPESSIRPIREHKLSDNSELPLVDCIALSNLIHLDNRFNSYSSAALLHFDSDRLTCLLFKNGILFDCNGISLRYDSDSSPVNRFIEELKTMLNFQFRNRRLEDKLGLFLCGRVNGNFKFLDELKAHVDANISYLDLTKIICSDTTGSDETESTCRCSEHAVALGAAMDAIKQPDVEHQTT
ncbi:MAG: hypothetical protein GF315_06740 [candidate division Zixibacteria bacterium]|nr:hypothetical protein [candidate division Zixibacteria bacterium]